MKRPGMQDWIDAHFSDNVKAQKTIAVVAGVILVIGFVPLAVAAVVLLLAR